MSRVSRTKELICEFGIGVTAAKLFQAATKNIPHIRYATGQWKYRAITRCLFGENKELLEQLNRNKHTTEWQPIGSDSPVWMLWWQGIDNAPDIVKLCVHSVEAHKGNRPLILLDENNYEEYVCLPSHYKDLYTDGKISRTQFSDILRLNLLYKWGGVWLDATYLLTSDLDAAISDYPFYTIRHGMEKEYPMSKGLWTGSAIASGRGNIAIKLFIDIYDRYYQKHDKLIDYLLIDYIFAVCCDNCPVVRKMFEEVPTNNINVNEMFAIMNEPYEEVMLGKLGNTYMNKLNWKHQFMEWCDGKVTTYGYYNKLYHKKHPPD